MSTHPGNFTGASAQRRAEPTCAADWTFITVTYNSARTLETYWAHRAEEAPRWIVVDNGSTDGSADIAAGLGADVIAGRRNIGFSAANNLGLDICTSTFVAFLNPDIRVGLDTLPLLEQTVRRTDGLVAPQLLHDDQRIQHNGRGLPFLADKLAHRGVRSPWSKLAEYLPAASASSPTPYYVAWLMGAAVFGRTTTFRRIGGWDPRFFLYYEDHEIGMRAWARGVSVVLDPRVSWMHGWARATSRPNCNAWREEVLSALRFYRMYPEFLLPTRTVARRRHPRLVAHFQKPVPLIAT